MQRKEITNTIAGDDEREHGVSKSMQNQTAYTHFLVNTASSDSEIPLAASVPEWPRDEIDQWVMPYIICFGTHH